ncbi:MAG: HAMP domain-containing protein [Archaeoglobi archaeon]|nr:HAMP domain-containing protein [Archaeoglobi archaeon]
MKLQTKLVAVIVVSFLGMLILSVVYVTYSVVSISDKIEQMVVEMESGSIERFMDRQVDELGERCAVYLNAESFSDLGDVGRRLENPVLFKLLGISAAIVLDSSYEEVASLAYDSRNGSWVRVPDRVRESIGTMVEHRSGIILLDRPAIFSVHPVETLSEENGYVVFVRYIDEHMISELKSHEDVEIGLSDRRVEEQVYELRDGNLIVYLPLRDVRGDIALVFEYSLHPYWRDLSRFGVLSAIVFVSATTVVVGFAVLIVLGRDVERIREISEFTRSVTEHGYSDRRLEVRGDDEISSLAESINTMLDEIQKSQRSLEMANENLRFLNRLMRHDLLNRLTRIMGLAELGLERKTPEFYEGILEAVEDSARLIERVKNLEVAFTDYRPERIDLREVIEEVMKNYDIAYEIHGDATVLADVGIYSVVDNLVSNAIRHGGTERVEFEIAEKGEYVELRVKDYGRGIPDEIKEEIFREGFSTADSLGLGLYIVRRIVERYGGKVWVEDNPEGGAVFVIRLPRA